MGNGRSASEQRRAGGRDAQSRSGQDCRRSTMGCSSRARIVSVEFLNGNEDTVLTADADHYVNLPQDGDYASENYAANIDRMSRCPRVKVTFNRAGSHSFKAKLLPSGGNSSYTAAEKSRNSNFAYEWREKQFTSNSDGTKIISGDFFVTAAGKSKYKVKAEDAHGNEVRSHEISAKRFSYYVTLPMRGVAAAGSLSTFRREMARHDIKMTRLANRAMTHMPNVGPEDMSRLTRLARRAYGRTGASGKEPYVIAVVFTDQLAAKRENATFGPTRAVDVGPARTHPFTFGIRYAGLRSGDGVNDRYLWIDVVPGENWLISATYQPEGGGSPVDIPPNKCTAVPTSAGASSSKQVNIDVSWLPAGRGHLTLKVNLIDRMRGGLASDGNLVVICTRAWWSNKNSASQNQTLIHEVGHKCGMVADGTGSGPDRTPNQYTDKGHVGSHCYRGLGVQASYSGSASVNSSTCVMFGATNGHTRYCVSCRPAIRKQDLSRGWSRF